MYFRILKMIRPLQKEVVYGLVFEYQGNFESMNVLPKMQNQLEYQMTLQLKITRYTLPDITAFVDTTLYALILSRNMKMNFTPIIMFILPICWNHHPKHLL